MGRQLPALAGLAIALVVLHHAIDLGVSTASRLGFSQPEGLAPAVVNLLWAAGIFAVPSFLFISGAFVAYAARGPLAGLSLNFVRTTLTRIVCPYVCWSLVCYLAAFLWLGERSSALGYVKNLFVGYPFHFVPLLVFWYGLSPVLVPLATRHGAALIAVVGVCQLVVLNLVHPGALGFEFPQSMQWLAPPVLRRTLSTWAVCFPLGLVYGLNSPAILPRLTRARWAIGTITAALFAASFVSPIAGPHQVLIQVACSTTFLLLIPLISREGIPFAAWLERVGRRSYGIYLAHLAVLMLALYLVERLAPQLLAASTLVVLFLFVLALGIPLFLMERGSRTWPRPVYRFVFG